MRYYFTLVRSWRIFKPKVSLLSDFWSAVQILSLSIQGIPIQRKRNSSILSRLWEKMGPTDKISRQNVIRAASMLKWTHIQTALELQSSLTNAVTLPQKTHETSAISFHLPDQPCSMLETFFYKSIIAQRFLSATTTDLQLQDGVWRWFQGLWPTGRSDRSRNFK